MRLVKGIWARRLRRDERGIALTDVLISMSLFGVVMSATLGMLDVGARIAPRDQERARAIHEAQSGLDRMVRELRQASRVLGTTPESVEVLVRIRGDDPATTDVEDHYNRHVLYSCGELNPTRCSRYEAPPGEPLPSKGATVVERVLNWDAGSDPARRVFSFPEGDAVRPKYIAVRIEVPAKGERTDGPEHKVVLEDGFHARNLKISG